MTITDDSLTLLECFFDILLRKFLTSKTIGSLSKQSRIRNCCDEVVNFMESTPNAVFTIKNTEKGKDKESISTMALVMSTVPEKNDHVKVFNITISESGETFKAERQLGCIDYEKSTRSETIIEFEKSRL